jgi:hypothetical protein
LRSSAVKPACAGWERESQERERERERRRERDRRKETPVSAPRLKQDGGVRGAPYHKPILKKGNARVDSQACIKREKGAAAVR